MRLTMACFWRLFCVFIYLRIFDCLFLKLCNLFDVLTVFFLSFKTIWIKSWFTICNRNQWFILALKSTYWQHSHAHAHTNTYAHTLKQTHINICAHLHIRSFPRTTHVRSIPLGLLMCLSLFLSPYVSLSFYPTLTQIKT